METKPQQVIPQLQHPMESIYITKIEMACGPSEVFLSLSCFDPATKTEKRVGQFAMSMSHFSRLRDLCNRIPIGEKAKKEDSDTRLAAASQPGKKDA